ncbi:ferrochelatase [Desulfopila sp. IMCC35008]|uniref:ferrochelatase n=1 Tax=Desulfopila sp. IMCC35008 TaxID=2653858 RepID=UPI002714D742|nr:ferrochelatase [Desulfopila sp. IMCC35008]
MGGPDTLEDVPAFLYNLFSDRDIIKLGPALLQKPLARLISRRRAAKSKAIYSKIGGGSPLLKITTDQAQELQKRLSATHDCEVDVAMRYWQPRADEALQKLCNRDIDILVALPLYPHYTKATSGSSLKDLRSVHKQLVPDIPLVEIPSWPTQEKYLQALAAKIRQGARKFGDESFQLVYSAHSLPVTFIQEGDPYVEELKKTIQGLEGITGIQGQLCYQSRSGPVEWLSPSTSETIEALGSEGCKNILMVPVSFVSDHVETLYEINMLFRDKAADLGMRLYSTESLNSDPLFIDGLRDLVVATLEQQ